MTAEDRLFLIVFDRESDSSEVRDLGHDVDSAIETYNEVEHEYARRDDVEVALVGSQSLETLRSTHSSYFPDRDGLAAILASVRG
jgi:hypothetical protein